MTLQEVNERLKQANKDLKFYRAQKKRILYSCIYPLMDEIRDLREVKKRLKQAD